MQDRNSAENQRWKREVRRRDGNACRVCGVQRNIHVHHIKPFKKYPDFAADIDNGITLCGNCHTLFRGKEESTNLQTITEAVTGQPDIRTTDQLKRLNGKFCTYLDSLLESNERFTRNKGVHQLFTHLQIYPDSLDRFLPLIRHLLNKESSRFSQGLVAQMAVECLEDNSSGAALQMLREYEERFEAEEEERSELFPCAHQGDAEAQFRLGEMCATGKEDPRSSRAALKYYRDAALQGHVEAQFRVGNMYRSCTRVFDNSEANKWHRKAAEQGHAEAQYTLGQMCDDGLRDQEAFQWYHKAAEQGYAEAQYRLGQIYEGEDSDVRYFKEYREDDKAEGLYWYIEAAEQGHAEAQYKLGEMYEDIAMYEDIEVCLRDYSGSEDYKVEAFQWYRKAAEQGYASAQYNLGWIYANGKGVAQDDEMAVEWFRRAARQGNAVAQSELARRGETFIK
jgi:TPR repeat protein